MRSSTYGAFERLKEQLKEPTRRGLSPLGSGLLPHSTPACDGGHEPSAAGVPPHLTRDIVGHKDLQVTSLYARSHDDALCLAAAALIAYQGRA
jgi:hypothetical protein